MNGVARETRRIGSRVEANAQSFFADVGRREKVVVAPTRADNVERVVNYAVLKDDPRRFASPSGSYGEAPDKVTPPANP